MEAEDSGKEVGEKVSVLEKDIQNFGNALRNIFSRVYSSDQAALTDSVSAEALKSSVDFLSNSLADSAKRVDESFTRAQIRLLKAHPEMALKDDISTLREELARKERQCAEMSGRLERWRVADPFSARDPRLLQSLSSEPPTPTTSLPATPHQMPPTTPQTPFTPLLPGPIAGKPMKLQ